MKFNVGDRVRIKDECSYSYSGELATIASCEKHDWYGIIVDKDRNSIYFRDDEMELVVEPKFKVGDKVKIIMNGFFNGFVGKIKKPCTVTYFDWMVKFPEFRMVYAFSEDEMELYTEETDSVLDETALEEELVDSSSNQDSEEFEEKITLIYTCNQAVNEADWDNPYPKTVTFEIKNVKGGFLTKDSIMEEFSQFLAAAGY